jgi:hypothetical protein
MIWRHDKIVRQRRSRATSRHSFITTVWWYNILYQTPCIRQATFFKFKGKRTKCLINTHYIHSVVVQDFVSGRVCCVNQYHYESRYWRVVMQLVHATDKTWYKVLYHHTMYVIRLSNISIKTNFKQIARVESKCVHYSEGDYILCMTSRYFFRSFTNVRLLCFVSHSNDMKSCQSSSAENVSCNVAPFFYRHSVVIQHLVSDTLYQTGDFR